MPFSHKRKSATGGKGETRETRARVRGPKFEVFELRTQNFELHIMPVAPVSRVSLVTRSGLEMTSCLC